MALPDVFFLITLLDYPTVDECLIGFTSSPGESSSLPNPDTNAEIPCLCLKSVTPISMSDIKNKYLVSLCSF